MRRFALLLLLFLGPAGAAPQLRVQVQLPDGNQAVVGQTVPLQVDVLTDSWFTSAPQLPGLALPGVVVTPPDERAQHLTLNLDGTPFFGMRYTWRLTLSQPGEVQIPALVISAQPGNAVALLSARSQPLQLRVDWPQAAGRNLLVASDVQLSQTLGSLEGLKVGDSLVRSVTLRATDSLALLLPVTPLAEVRGLSRFVKTPQLSSPDDLSGQRIDSASYRIEHPGTFHLPAIEVQWWSSRDHRLHSAQVPAVDFSAVAAPAAAPAFSVSEDLQRLGRESRLHLSRHWLAALTLALMVGTLGYLVHRHGAWLREQWRQWRQRPPARVRYGLRPLNPTPHRTSS